MTAEETDRALLEQLPDDVSVDDIAYHLYVVQGVERGLADIEAGRTLPHAQVVAELSARRERWRA